jgi:hypothetical protein
MRDSSGCLKIETSWRDSVLGVYILDYNPKILVSDTDVWFS